MTLKLTNKGQRTKDEYSMVLNKFKEILKKVDLDYENQFNEIWEEDEFIIAPFLKFLREVFSKNIITFKREHIKGELHWGYKDNLYSEKFIASIIGQRYVKRVNVWGG